MQHPGGSGGGGSGGGGGGSGSGGGPRMPLQPPCWQGGIVMFGAETRGKPPNMVGDPGSSHMTRFMYGNKFVVNQRRGLGPRGLPLPPPVSRRGGGGAGGGGSAGGLASNLAGSNEGAAALGAIPHAPDGLAEGGSDGGAVAGLGAALVPATPQPSHYMYGGLHGLGTVCVPWTRPDMAALCGAVVEDWAVGVLWTLTENKPPAPAPMRMYFDLDMQFANMQQVQAMEDAWPAVAKAIIQEIHRFYPGVTDTRFLRALVLASGVRKCAVAPARGAKPASAGGPLSRPPGEGGGSGSGSGGGGGSGTGVERAPAPASALLAQAGLLADGAVGLDAVRTGSVLRAGVHLVFPELHVSVDQALMIAAAVVERLNLDGLPCGTRTDWNECVDSGVYHERRGLRWAWQVKHGTCGGCGGSKAGPTARRCTTCGGSGVVAARGESMYTPRCRLDSRGNLVALELRHVRSPTEALLLEASVRGPDPVYAPSPGWTLYAGHPCKPTLRLRHDTVQVVAPDGAAKAPRNGSEVGPGDARWAVLQALVRRTHCMYARVSMSKVFHIVSARGPGRYCVFIKGMGATFCQIKEARATAPGGDGVVSHHSRNVNFRVTSEFIVQECKSPKCVGSSSGPKPLSDAEKHALFGAVGSMHGGGGAVGGISSSQGAAMAASQGGGAGGGGAAYDVGGGGSGGGGGGAGPLGFVGPAGGGAAVAGASAGAMAGQTPFTTAVQHSLLGETVSEELKDTPALACVGPRFRQITLLTTLRAQYMELVKRKVVPHA